MRWTYVAERRTTRMILLIQRSMKRWRKVYVAQVGQRSRVIAYRYLLSRWLRAGVYTKMENFTKIVTLTWNKNERKFYRIQYRDIDAKNVNSIVYSIETLSQNLCRLIKNNFLNIFKDTYLIPGTLGISHEDLGRGTSMKPWWGSLLSFPLPVITCWSINYRTRFIKAS